MIFKSRFTPGLANGERVQFNIGEVVKYTLQDGEVINIQIDSGYREHLNGERGYEAIFSDDHKRYFAVSKQITDWNGKGDLNKTSILSSDKYIRRS